MTTILFYICLIYQNLISGFSGVCSTIRLHLHKSAKNFHGLVGDRVNHSSQLVVHYT